MHILDEIAAEGDQVQNAEEAAEHRGKKHMPEIRRQLENVQRRDGKNRTGDYHAACGADGLNNHIFRKRILALHGGGNSDGDNGDGNCRLEHLTDFQSQVRRSSGKQNGKK